MIDDQEILTLLKESPSFSGLPEEEAKRIVAELKPALCQFVDQTCTEHTAKLRETLARLEQQNIELSSSHEQLSELASIKRTALNRIEDLHDRVLPTLETHLTHVAAQLGGEFLAELVGLKLEVREVIDKIQPLAVKASTEQSLRSKRVLVAEAQRKNQVVMKMALGGSGVDLTLVPNLLDAKTAFQQHQFDLVMATHDHVEILLEALEQHRTTELILIAPAEVRDYLEILEKHPEICHLVTRNEENRLFTTRTVLATATKLLSQDLFGMEKYLAWGADVHEWKVQRSDQRNELIDGMKKVFSTLGVRQSLLDRCALVSEEMLMNAIYDAPVDELGEAKYNHMDRTETIDLNINEQGLYRVACDGNFLAVSVSDPFGSLTRETILMYLRSCYEGHAGVYNTQKGGAGRGLHQIVESSDLTVFNVKKGMRTEVISLFFLGGKANEQSRLGLHFFFD